MPTFMFDCKTCGLVEKEMREPPEQDLKCEVCGSVLKRKYCSFTIINEDKTKEEKLASRQKIESLIGENREELESLKTSLGDLE